MYITGFIARSAISSVVVVPSVISFGFLGLTTAGETFAAFRMKSGPAVGVEPAVPATGKSSRLPAKSVLPILVTAGSEAVAAGSV